MKCSELAVATSNLLAELIPKYLDQVNLHIHVHVAITLANG